jgi:hypothetical protein
VNFHKFNVNEAVVLVAPKTPFEFWWVSEQLENGDQRAYRVRSGANELLVQETELVRLADRVDVLLVSATIDPSEKTRNALLIALHLAQHVEDRRNRPLASKKLLGDLEKSGGIFKADWFQLWESKSGKFPPLEFIIGSVDGAFTSKESNDPSAMSVWGVFLLNGQRRIILLDCWRKHLQFSADRNLIAERTNETHAVWRQRTQQHWGLLEHIRESATYLHGTRLGTGGNVPMSRLLIEAAGPGLPAATELASRYPELRGVIQPLTPRGDKLARALAVQPTLSQGLVYAPNLDWAELLIREAEVFPFGKTDDLTDTMSQALKYLRDVGLAETDHEVHYAAIEGVMHKPRLKPLYPC